MKTALVIGATGLVGSQLVRLLLDDERFGDVKVFTRRATGIKHEKLTEQLIDFDRLVAIKDAIQGDVLFSSLGTTIRTAGTQERQYQIDYTYQFEFAQLAAGNGVKTYVLISAAGAAPGSLSFYMRMKGELERDVARLPFQHIHILQPGFLDGERTENRPGERFGLAALKLINGIGALRSYRPIHARTVAAAMIEASFDESTRFSRHGPKTLFALGQTAVI